MPSYPGGKNGPGVKTRAQLVRECLEEGPSTMPEVAVSLEISERHAHAWLWMLRKQGHVRKMGKIKSIDAKSAERNLNLYALTERGEAATRAGKR